MLQTRTSKTRNTSTTKYINDIAFSLVQVLMETDNAGVVQAIYNYGNDLISMNRSGVNSYYHYDGLGSTRQLTDSSEAVVASYTYDGFGNKIAGTGTSENVYGFTGEQQFNEADNLVFLRARYYKPSIGRFISRDPIGYRAGLNLYAYVRNNPINRKDPSGLADIPWVPPGEGGSPYAPRWMWHYPSLDACMGDAMSPFCSSLWAYLGMGGLGGAGIFCPPAGAIGAAWALWCSGEAIGAYLYCTAIVDSDGLPPPR